MQNNTSLWLGGGILVALVLVGGLLILRPHTAMAPGQGATTTAQMGTTTSPGNGVSITGTGSSTVTVISNNSVQAPSLGRPMTFSASLSPDVVAQLRTDEQSTIEALQANPLQANEWLQLAVDYKVAGDYQGAANVWTYLTEVLPTNYIAFANLGDLYQNFLVNYPKAESNYLMAIQLNPTVIDYYNDLYNLYRYDEKNNTAANAIVAQGLKANPNNPTLLQLQSQESAQ